jgi:hypothetical protein
MTQPTFASTRAAVPRGTDPEDVVIYIARALGRSAARSWLQFEAPDRPEYFDESLESE